MISIRIVGGTLSAICVLPSVATGFHPAGLLGSVLVYIILGLVLTIRTCETPGEVIRMMLLWAPAMLFDKPEWLLGK